MKQSSKRAMNVAIGGIVLSIVGFIACLITGIITNIAPVQYVAWQTLGSLIIWVYLVVYFNNYGLAEQEKRDEAILKSQQSTIFQDSKQREVLFSVARKRLITFERWGSVVFSLLVAGYTIGIGIWLIYKLRGGLDLAVKNPLAGASAMVVVWFASFLLARYASGMASEDVWKPLKAAGSYLLSTSILAILVSIALAAKFFNNTTPMLIVAWAVPIVMLIFGCETILNTILDIYRPRIKGSYHSPGLDSRLFGALSQPGGILHTAASTIDYQFGFKVSQTWFYKLLEKAVLPLLALLFLCMYLMSCFVVVGPGQMATIEHLGSTDNGSRVIGPGMHFKLPTPFDRAFIHDTERLQQINIGIMDTPETDKETDELIKKPLLWGKKHQEVEYRLLVATEASETINSKEAPPVSLIIAAVPVQFRVSNIYDFLYNHKDPKAILEDLSHREIARYMASAKLETDIFGGESSDNESVLGAGRRKASQILTQRIQAKADELGLGVKIVTVGLQGIHPPLDVAADYERVIGAIQQRQQTILSSLAERNKVITELGGSLEQVDKLYEMLISYESSKDSMDEAEQQQKLKELDSAFAASKGEIAKRFSDAEKYAFEKEVLAKASGERFSSQVMAYKAAPELYLQNQRLLTLENSLAKVRKYVVVSDDADSEVMVIDLQEKLNPDLYDLEIPTN